MKANPFLRAALFYASRFDWPVFPVKPRDKKPPLTKNGCLDASTDEKQIREWWRKWPQANVGIRTGVRFWVLDIDPHHGGDLSRDRLVARYGPLADTLRQITGGGGWQYFYELPEQAVIHGKAPLYDDWPGIDARGENNYVLAPPSIHPDTGNEYAWDTGKDTILHEPIHPANAWLLEWVLNASRNGPGRGPVELPEILEKGSRDETIYRMACAFRRARADFDQVLEHLTEYDRLRCRPPLGAAKIREKVENAWKKPPGDGKAEARANGAAKEEIPPLVRVRGGTIYDAQYRERAAIIEPILYPGLTILAGRPKMGKGWFAFQMAVALVTGGKLAKYFDVTKHLRVLYLSLEDRDWQVQYRQRQLGIPREVMERIEWSFELEQPLMAGGAAALDASLQHDPVDVLIVDSQLAIVRQAKREGLDVMQADYNISDTLRQIAEKHKNSVVLINHTTKTLRDYALDAIQGTTGTTAATDTAWVFQRTRAGETTLSTIGRQVPENVYALKREEGPAWTIIGEGDEVLQSESRQDILQLLRDNGPMKPSQMAGRLHRNISGVHRLLVALCDLSLVTKTSYGTYQIALPQNAPVDRHQ